MQSLRYSIDIRAPRAHVYQTMLAEKTYREWAAAFAEGSSYQGSWDKGSQILFSDGKGSGMNARIAENTPAEFVSIEMLSYGVPSAPRQWNDVFENYSYSEKNGMTTLQVDIRVPAEWAEYLDSTWPHALEKLKTICEGGNPP